MNASRPRGESRSDDPSRQGLDRSSDTLLLEVYEELRALAAARLAREAPGQTLQPTDLVHDSYDRLAHGGRAVAWRNEAHFFGAASIAMRRILVERARVRTRRRRLAPAERITLADIVLTEVPDPGQDVPSILDLHDAIERLEIEDPRLGEIVRLRFFAGLEVAAIAVTLGISASTVKREWAFARAWLREQLSDGSTERSRRAESIEDRMPHL